MKINGLYFMLMQAKTGKTSLRALTRFQRAQIRIVPNVLVNIAMLHSFGGTFSQFSVTDEQGIHLRPETDKLDGRCAIAFVLEFTDDFGVNLRK
jgi:hypothetical protein